MELAATGTGTRSGKRSLPARRRRVTTGEARLLDTNLTTLDAIPFDQLSPEEKINAQIATASEIEPDFGCRLGNLNTWDSVDGAAMGYGVLFAPCSCGHNSAKGSREIATWQHAATRCNVHNQRLVGRCP
jgi:hypothetical protein